jgi:hypothetical protein
MLDATVLPPSTIHVLPCQVANHAVPTTNTKHTFLTTFLVYATLIFGEKKSAPLWLPHACCNFDIFMPAVKGISPTDIPNLVNKQKKRLLKFESQNSSVLIDEKDNH